jgi:rubrerythrin
MSKTTDAMIDKMNYHQTLYHDHLFVSALNSAKEQIPNLLVCTKCGYNVRVGPPIEIVTCPAYESFRYDNSKLRGK